ncbi:MAG: transketolase [Candidatus Omnitrophica bacterium]|nr:transketolase [Candidatus Omnitrophota bacterium]
MNKINTAILNKKAKAIRKDIIDICVRNQAGHIAPSFSTVEILTVLYYGIMNYQKNNPEWEDRDRLVLSKAHGCYGLFAILSDIGVIPKKEWGNFYTRSGKLSGCVERKLCYGLEVGCGSLGHGLPIAVGIAYGAKKQKKKYHTFCLTGDGELQEGSNWEALQFAVKHKVNNLTIIIDANRLQAMDFLANILDRKDYEIINRLKGFGLHPEVCSGHCVAGLFERLKKKPSKNVPRVIVAKTIKGYGLKCMENVPKFHYRVPTGEELDAEDLYGQS